jgi:hypothetical protein
MNFVSKFISGISSNTIIPCKGPIYKNIKYISKGDILYTYKHNYLCENKIIGIDRYLIDINDILHITFNFGPVKNNKNTIFYTSDLVCTKYQKIYCNDNLTPILADDLKITDKPINFNNIFIRQNELFSTYKTKSNNSMIINIKNISKIDNNNYYLDIINNKIPMYNINIDGLYFANFLMTNSYQDLNFCIL